MEDIVRPRRWEIDQRLEFIEFRLYWEGSIRRADLQQKFGISTPQASADLTRYRESAPENLEYDLSRKCYVPTEAFAPVFYTPNPDRYLAQLRAMKNGILDSADTFIGALPELDILPIPSRSISADLLRRFILAIRTKQSIAVEYQSMNEQHPHPMWRTISPLAIGSDGMRWHIRGYCHLTRKHKDFIISRCLQVGALSKWHDAADDDHRWNNFFDVVLKPNDEFSEAQKRTIERDYGMNNGVCIIPVRLALLYYFDKRMRLDVSAEKDRPKERPLVVENQAAYSKMLREVSS